MHYCCLGGPNACFRCQRMNTFACWGESHFLSEYRLNAKPCNLSHALQPTELANESTRNEKHSNHLRKNQNTQAHTHVYTHENGHQQALIRIKAPAILNCESVTLWKIRGRSKGLTFSELGFPQVTSRHRLCLILKVVVLYVEPWNNYRKGEKRLRGGEKQSEELASRPTCSVAIRFSNVCSCRGWDARLSGGSGGGTVS